MQKSDIGLFGLGVMGKNIVLNMESRGFRVSVYNRTVSKVDDFLINEAKDKNIFGAKSLEDFVNSLSSPKKIFIMTKAGKPVDAFIESLIPILSEGDILIDGGNSFYLDSERRCNELASKGILFVGTGVSGGEEGALLGPSIMPGGNSKAWNEVKNIFQSIAAKANDVPCCDWVGEGGSGHFVKMVHNGIEYGDMQLICESFHIMKEFLHLDYLEIAEVFSTWNNGELKSYLIEITNEILKKTDDDTGKHILDVILDLASEKGTGRWTVNSALELKNPVTLIAEAVFARSLSALKDERVAASKILKIDDYKFNGDKIKFLENLKDALYASKIVSYAQGFSLMRQASIEYNWNLNFGGISLMWREGCIIRSDFLEKIKDAYSNNANLSNLMLDNFFKEKILRSLSGWRSIVSEAVLAGIPIPAMSTALSYFDGYRCERLPANLLQAQRDFFGAHTYERVDKPRGEMFHTKW